MSLIQKTAIIFLALGLVCELSSTSATRYKVGDEDGWKLGSADHEAREFKVGDSLFFPYDHSVHLVSQEDFDACNNANPIKTYKAGNTVVDLSDDNSYYFIPGIQRHCAGGLKLAARMLAEETAVPASSPSSSASPSPSPASAAPAPSPTSTSPAPTPAVSAPASSPAALPSAASPAPAPAPASTTPAPASTPVSSPTPIPPPTLPSPAPASTPTPALPSPPTSSPSPTAGPVSSPPPLVSPAAEPPANPASFTHVGLSVIVGIAIMAAGAIGFV